MRLSATAVIDHPTVAALAVAVAGGRAVSEAPAPQPVPVAQAPALRPPASADPIGDLLK